MIFEYDLTVPASTSESSPVSVEMDLAYGVVHRLEVFFPPGCHNLVKVIIRRGVHQVWPTNPDGRLKADAFTISYPVWHEMFDRPYRLIADGWSDDTVYPHSITVRLGMQRPELLTPVSKVKTVLGRLSEMAKGKR